MDGINVLSLFDGMSCGRIALDQLGIKVDNYFASEIDKHAIKVTQHNYPNTIQIGDVTKVKHEDLPKIDLLIGGSPCFTADTKIITKGSIKPIELVKEGDEVLTHKGLYQKVLRIGGQDSDIYELQTQSGTVTETTEGHPYYTKKRRKVWNNAKRAYEFKFEEAEFVKVRDLTKVHYLATPILNTSENPMGLTVGSHEKDMFSEKVKIKHSFYKHTQSTYRAVFSSKRLVEYVEDQCGSSAYTKHLGKGILDLPPHLLKRVIEGYLFADGSFRKGTHRATTVSVDLIESLTLAIAKVYRTTTSVVFTKRPKTTQILGRTVKQSDTWTISFRESHPKKSRAWVIEEFIWNPIKKLVKTDKRKQVFNLEVGEDNSYVANNHVVHNCQSFSFAGKQKGMITKCNIEITTLEQYLDLKNKDFEFQGQSFLFWEYVRLLKEVKPKYFMLENVRMSEKWRNIISEIIGFEPIYINSNLVSIQNRPRLYWTNIPDLQLPVDEKLSFQDIKEDAPLRKVGNWVFKKWGDKIKLNQLKTLNTNKLNCLTTSKTHSFMYYTNEDKTMYRNLTLNEAKIAQTIPNSYDISIVPEGKAFHMIGNGWTVEIIKHIFKNIK